MIAEEECYQAKIPGLTVNVLFHNFLFYGEKMIFEEQSGNKLMSGSGDPGEFLSL